MRTRPVHAENQESCGLTHTDFLEYAKDLSLELPPWTDYVVGARTAQGARDKDFAAYDPWVANDLEETRTLYILKASTLNFLEWRSQIGLAHEFTAREVQGFPVGEYILGLKKRVTTPEVEL